MALALLESSTRSPGAVFVAAFCVDATAFGGWGCAGGVFTGCWIPVIVAIAPSLRNVSRSSFFIITQAWNGNILHGDEESSFRPLTSFSFVSWIKLEAEGSDIDRPNAGGFTLDEAIKENGPQVKILRRRTFKSVSALIGNVVGGRADFSPASRLSTTLTIVDSYKRENPFVARACAFAMITSG
jgi:hypothetical protein